MTGDPGIYTFLIADIRGYSRYTDEFGGRSRGGADGPVRRPRDGGRRVARRQGCRDPRRRGARRVHVRAPGDRCAVALQVRFGEEAALDHDLPLRVGIGIDSGEAVALEDGSFRGAALNIAARLCGRAHGGDVIVTEATYRLAGRIEGLAFSDRAAST